MDTRDLVNGLHAEGVGPWFAELTTLLENVCESPVRVEDQVLSFVQVRNLCNASHESLRRRRCKGTERMYLAHDKSCGIGTV
jgi:hypothetical protein